MPLQVRNSNFRLTLSLLNIINETGDLYDRKMIYFKTCINQRINISSSCYCMHVLSSTDHSKDQLF